MLFKVLFGIAGCHFLVHTLHLFTRKCLNEYLPLTYHLRSKDLEQQHPHAPSCRISSIFYVTLYEKAFDVLLKSIENEKIM